MSLADIIKTDFIHLLSTIAFQDVNQLKYSPKSITQKIKHDILSSLWIIFSPKLCIVLHITGLSPKLDTMTIIAGYFNSLSYLFIYIFFWDWTIQWSRRYNTVYLIVKKKHIHTVHPESLSEGEKNDIFKEFNEVIAPFVSKAHLLTFVGKESLIKTLYL